MKVRNAPQASTAGQQPSMTAMPVAIATNDATGRSQRLVLDNFPDPKLARQLSPNGRAHWATKRRAREQVETVVGVAIWEQRLTDALCGWPVRITYRWVMPDRRRRDLDNHTTGVVKVVQDCLVRLGMISSDDSETVVAVTTEIRVEKGQRRLEVVIAQALGGPADAPLGREGA